MSTATPPSLPKAAGQRAAQFDALHTARARSPLPARLYAAAMGEDYPHEVHGSSSCDWPLLGTITARLKMNPGKLLVDAGCGTGGTGLWLARALAVRLHGLDISPAAVDQAAARAHAFGLPAYRASFHIAALEDTGLPGACAHGVVCVDALGFACDRAAALRELGRILAPGGRLLLTRSLRRGAEPVWEQQAQAAGLAVEAVDERPGEPAMWQRLYTMWIADAEQLRRELGDAQADNMLREAHRMLPRLPGRRAVLLTLRRPPSTHTTPSPADSMILGPGAHDAAPYSERTSS